MWKYRETPNPMQKARTIADTSIAAHFDCILHFYHIQYTDTLKS